MYSFDYWSIQPRALGAILQHFKPIYFQIVHFGSIDEQLGDLDKLNNNNTFYFLPPYPGLDLVLNPKSTYCNVS